MHATQFMLLNSDVTVIKRQKRQALSNYKILQVTKTDKKRLQWLWRTTGDYCDYK